MKKATLALFAALLAALTLAGCNTVHGLGQDVRAAAPSNAPPTATERRGLLPAPPGAARRARGRFCSSFLLFIP